MRLRLAAWLVGLTLWSSTPATKGLADPPVVPEVTGPLLEAPREGSDTPPPSPPATPMEEKPALEPGSNARPLLILPGMAARGSSKPKTRADQTSPKVILSTPLAGDSTGSDDSDPIFKAPIEDRPSDFPSTLESIPTEKSNKPSDLVKPSRESSGKPSGNRPSSASRSTPTQRRPSTALGRFFALPGRGRWDDDGDSIRVDAKSDPAADAAMKRRVEKQIRENLGPRLKAFDVRILGRDIVIRAQAVRFWQKRSTRMAIEALPVLSGYNVLVEVVD